MWFSRRKNIPKTTLHRRFSGEVTTHKKVLGGHNKLALTPAEEEALAARVGESLHLKKQAECPSGIFLLLV